MNTRGERERGRVVLRTVLGLLLVLAVAALRMATLERAGLVRDGAAGPGASPEWPIDFYELRCEEVARNILEGMLTPDATGRIRLTGGAAELSVGGAAWVTHAGDRTLILFVAWRTPSGLGGHLYVSEPLGEAVVSELPDGQHVVNIVGPAGLDHSGARIEARLERKLGPNWHRVSIRLDG